VADENAHLACEKLVQLGKVCSGLACGDGYSQLRIHCDEVVAGGEVSFSETEDGGDSRSMGCHKTQAQDLGWLLVLPEDLADRAIDTEYFILRWLEGADVPRSHRETSLFGD